MNTADILINCTFIALTVNEFFMLEIIINALLQHRDLNRWVTTNWKLPLLVSFLFASCALIFIQTSRHDNYIYLVSLFCTIVQTLLMLDYHRMLKRYITSSWYLLSTKINWIIGVICILLIITCILYGLIVIDFN